MALAVRFVLAFAVVAAALVASAHTPIPLSRHLHDVDKVEVRPGVHALRGRGLALQSQGLPLWGGITTLAEYYAQIWVGTNVSNTTATNSTNATTHSAPLQGFRVQVDTGSSTLAVPGSQCSSCSEGPNNPFVSGLSATMQHVSCSICTRCACDGGDPIFEVGYGDGSRIRGPFISDWVAIGGEPRGAPQSLSARTTFGLVSYASGNFENPNVDGILGVGFATLNDNIPTWIDELAASGQLAQKVFGMCLTENGGQWDLGYVNASRASGTIRYTNLIPPPPPALDGYYTVAISSITISGTALTVPLTSYNKIVDSGTTLLVLPGPVYDALESRLQSLSLPGASSLLNGGNDVLCVFLNDAEIAQWPDISFHFPDRAGGDIAVSLSASQYLLAYQGQRCFGVVRTAMNDVILGDVFMQGSYTVFDMTNRAVGFAPLRDCADPGAAPPSHRDPSNGGGGGDDTTNTIIGVVVALVVVAVVVAAVMAYRRRNRPRGVVSSYSNQLLLNQPAPGVMVRPMPPQPQPTIAYVPSLTSAPVVSVRHQQFDREEEGRL